MKRNQEYKNSALAALKGSWPQAVVATFIVLALSELVSALPGGIEMLAASRNLSVPVMVALTMLFSAVLMFLVVMPLMVYFANAFKRLSYQSDRNILSNLSPSGLADYFRNAAGMFLMSLVTYLLSLLLVVPGIIASLALFLTPYLLQDNPDLSVADTLRLSRKMMKGHKMQLFLLQLSFIGWILLNVLTLGLASLWITPYMMTTFAAFYHDVREQFIMKEGQQESAL